MKIAELNDVLKRVAMAHPLVNQAEAGDIYEIANSSDRVKYGLVVFTPNTAVRSADGVVTYNYYIYYADRLTRDEANMDLVQSDAVIVLKSILNRTENEIVAEVGDYSFNFFRHQLADICAGAWIEVDITVPDSDCDEFAVGELVHLRPITITKNGVYEAKNSGLDGYSSVTVNVQGGGTEMPKFVLSLKDDYTGVVEDDQLRDLIEYHKNGGTKEDCVILLNAFHRIVYPDVVYFGGNEITLKTGTGDEMLGVDIVYDTQTGSVTMNEFEAERIEDQIQEYLDDMEYADEGWVLSQGFMKEGDLEGKLKTINGESLVGTGNIEIKGSDKLEFVLTMTENQQELVVDDELTRFYNYIFEGGNVENCNVLIKINDNNVLHPSAVGFVPTSMIVITNFEGGIYWQVIINYGLRTRVTRKDSVDLTGYATEQWVEDKGYLTEHQSLTGYATEEWVENQGYMKDNELEGKLKTINGESIIGTGNIEIKGTGKPEFILSITDFETNPKLDDDEGLRGLIAYFEGGGNYEGCTVYINFENRAVVYPDLITIDQGVIYITATDSSLGNYFQISIFSNTYTVVDFNPIIIWFSEQIKTINGESIIGTGNIEIKGGDLTGYATEQWVQNQGYLTEHQSLTGYATEQWVEDKGYLTEHQSLTGYATEEWVEDNAVLNSSVFTGTEEQWNALSDEQKSTYIIALITE